MLLENPFLNNRVVNSDDHHPAWDVASFGQIASDTLTRRIGQTRSNPKPTGESRIVVLAGASGYGKSHLFARVQHSCADQVQTIYVPMTSDLERISVGDLIRWKLVEFLFINKTGFAPLRLLLAKLLQPCFLECLRQKAPRNVERIEKLNEELRNDPTFSLNILSEVAELEPYHHLADSFREQFPHLSSSVLRAFILGLSPAAPDAHAWIRGEGDCLSDARRKELLLTEPAPEVGEVLKATTALYARADQTVLLCVDQLEFLLQNVESNSLNALNTLLISWLQEIPNLVLAVGCLEGEWTHISSRGEYRSFLDRTEVIKLQLLTPIEAEELVTRRVRSWDGCLPIHSPGWPFDLNSVKSYAQQGLKPRFLIDECATEFKKWLAGSRTDLIRIPGGKPPLPEAFVIEWNRRVTHHRGQPIDLDALQEATVLRAFELALELRPHSRIWPRALKEPVQGSRPSSRIEFEQNGVTYSVLLTFTKRDGGPAFGHWVTALEEALGATKALGVVAVWPKDRLSVNSGKGLEKYKQYVKDGKIRPLPVSSNQLLIQELLALRQADEDARSGQFSLNGEAISVDELRQLINQTCVLADSPLYPLVFEGWSGLDPSPASTLPTVPPPPDSQAPLPRQSTSVAPPAKPPTIPSIPAQSPGATLTPLQQQLKAIVDFLLKRRQKVIADGVQQGPTFIRFRVRLEADADVGAIKRQAENLMTHLSLEVKPIIENHAGFVSIDVQRKDRETVPLTSLLAGAPPGPAGSLLIPAGVDVEGKTTWLDLSDSVSCHLLVAGTTGSGKSEFLKSIVASLCLTLPPDRVQFALVDPKSNEFNLPANSPYLLQETVFDAEGAIPLLQGCVTEMEKRYAKMRERGCQKLDELPPGEIPPRWVILFDEFANLMTEKESKKLLESSLKRLSSMARAAGIHLILGTQRPEAGVVTPLLRDNLPCRISFQVTTGKSSKIILDQEGAENLLGKGDFLLRRGGRLLRLQSPFIPRAELEAAVLGHGRSIADR